MIFQNANFNLILSLLNPRSSFLQWVVQSSGECQTGWSYMFCLTSAWTPRSQLRQNFHIARYGYSLRLHFEPGSCKLLDALYFVQWLIVQILTGQLHHSGRSARGLQAAFYILRETMTIKTNNYFSMTLGNDFGNVWRFSGQASVSTGWKSFQRL